MNIFKHKNTTKKFDKSKKFTYKNVMKELSNNINRI